MNKRNNKNYTKKQIAEAIAYWENKLRKMNESKCYSIDIKKTITDYLQCDKC